MTGRWIRGGCVGLVVSLWLLFPSPARAVHNADVDAAIAKAKAYLYAHENGGNWELIPVGNFDWSVCSKPDGAQFGGPTALVTYALLAAGEKPTDPHLAQAIDWLQKADVRGTYALGLRCQVWNLLPHDGKYKDNIKKDADALLASLAPKDQAAGMWNYMWEGQYGDYSFDHSNSQYGVLGLWACSECAMEIPTAKWKLMEDAWKAQQNPDGGWSYHYKAGAPEDSLATMTAAGIATLFLLQDELHGDAGLECKGNFKSDNLEKALKWMSQDANFQGIYNPPWAYYGLYGVERIGVAAGYRYFGSTDWYVNGADYLLAHQSADGSWGDTTWNTAFGLLFLQRGRGPVVMNKLEYMLDNKGAPTAANWNQRPRDAANLTKWLTRELEQDFNWQVVNLKNSPPEDWLDAPILYIAGNQMLNFSADDEAKLKKYVQLGGLIYGNADCTNGNFGASFQALGKKLFPNYAWATLPANDILYSESYNGAKWRAKPAINVLDNGVRHLMVLCPTADYSKAWQLRAFTSKPEAGEWFADLYLYAVEKKNMEFKGESFVIVPDARRTPDKTLKLARLQYTGNWDPEPGGWWRMAAVLNNDFGVALHTDAVTLGTGKLTSDYKVAHLTGTGELKLDDAAVAELKKFVTGGGTLIVDAAGGSGTFSESAETMLTATFGTSGKLEVLPDTSPVYSASGAKLDNVKYRAFARKTLGSLHGPRLRAITINNRPAIFFSGEDLSAGIVGNTVDGIIGYDPKSATAITTDLLLYAMGGGTAVARLPSLDFKHQIVWNGEDAAAGKGWTFPADAQTSIQPQTAEAFSGKTALEFKHAGQETANMGWNWFGYWPETAGTDISGFTNFSFRMKFAAPTVPASIAVHLNCSSTKQPSANIEVLNIDPTAADGKWHEIVIPIADLQAGAQFDPHKTWEFNLNVTSAAPQSFSIFIDDIGFDSRPAPAPAK